MTELLALLREGRAWPVEALADRLGTTPDDIRRQMEFLERTGFLRRVSGCGHDCRGCGIHCGIGDAQSGMPVFWEVVKRPVP